MRRRRSKTGGARELCEPCLIVPGFLQPTNTGREEGGGDEMGWGRSPGVSLYKRVSTGGGEGREGKRGHMK